MNIVVILLWSEALYKNFISFCVFVQMITRRPRNNYLRDMEVWL